MLKQDPNVHLPPIEITANQVKVVIKDLLHIVRLNRHYFRQELLPRFLFLLVILDHKLSLSLENLAKELATQFAHLNNFQGFSLLSVEVLWPDPNFPLKLKASTVGD